MSNKILKANGQYGNVKFNGRDRVLESKAFDEKEASLLMDEVARRWNFFEEHDRDEVKRKLKMLSKVYMIVHQYAGTLDFTDKIREAITVPSPLCTVGDLWPGEKYTSELYVQEGWVCQIPESGRGYQIPCKPDELVVIAIGPKNEMCILVSFKSTPCERVEEK